MKNIIHCSTWVLAILALVVFGCAQKVDVEADQAAIRNADALNIQILHQQAGLYQNSEIYLAAFISRER